MGNELLKNELKLVKSLNTPVKVQEFIDSLTYNKGKRVSVIDVFRKRKADCLEAACFASFVLSINGYKSYVMDLESHKDDDHVICVYKKNGFFGSVAQSKYLGLKSKSPVYKNLRELSMSYFEHFFTFGGVLDLKKRSVPIKLPKNYKSWVFEVKYVHALEERLGKTKHFRLAKNSIKLQKIGAEKYLRETMVIPKNAKVGKEYGTISTKIKRI